MTLERLFDTTGRTDDMVLTGGFTSPPNPFLGETEQMISSQVEPGGFYRIKHRGRLEPVMVLWKIWSYKSNRTLYNVDLLGFGVTMILRSAGKFKPADIRWQPTPQQRSKSQAIKFACSQKPCTLRPDLVRKQQRTTHN